MTDITTTIDAYIAAWNAADATERRALLDRTFADDARYLDPLMAGEGREQIEALIAGAQAQYPGMEFVLVAGPDAHHDRVRFAWQLRPAAGGDAIATGFDFATVADDGRLRDVTGFLELPTT